MFEKAQENEKLKEEIKALNSKLEDNDNAVKDTERQSQYESDQTRKRFNDLEQYTRINNIRVYGLLDNNKYETPSQTIDVFLGALKENKISTDIDETDIDIGHRLGAYQENRDRPVIIKFLSRTAKDEIIGHARALRKQRIYINEDLTKLNQQVFTAIRLKGKDEVKSVWTRNGQILLRRYDGSVARVGYEVYDQWLNLPWPVERYHSMD